MATLAATTPVPVVARAATLVRRAIQGLNFLAPVGDLVIRLWVANVFWTSGLTKIQSFETTIQLFQYEYEVPLLPPELAAYLGTFGELFFSVLLALGLAGRLGALGLFVLNVVAVISYPALNEAGITQHQLWGLLLLVPLLHGPGKLSVDHFLAKRFDS